MYGNAELFCFRVNFDFDLRPDGLKPSENSRRHREQVKQVLENGEDADSLQGYKDSVQEMYGLKPF